MVAIVRDVRATYRSLRAFGLLPLTALKLALFANHLWPRKVR